MTRDPAQRPALASLVDRAARGDRDAEGALCRALTPAVRIFAARRLGTQDAVDEMTQDALLLVLEAVRAGKVTDHERIGPFALGVCRNLARERARLRDRRRALWEQHGAVIETSWQPDPVVSRARLEDCLGRLTQRAREVLRRGCVEGESHAEIAVALGLSEANTRVMRHRALAALRDCLEPATARRTT